MEQRQPAFLAVVYHDEPEDAATDSSAEWWPSLNAAVEWARRTMSPTGYWNGLPSTVHYGFVVKSNNAPPRWEDDEREAPWLVYADSMERD